MPCRRCGREHKCARPGCGHSKSEDHCNAFLQSNQSFILFRCQCDGYVESEEERVCRLEAEVEERQPADALDTLKQLRNRIHETHRTYAAAGATPEECYVCGEGINKIIKHGEVLMEQQKILVQQYKQLVQIASRMSRAICSFLYTKNLFLILPNQKNSVALAMAIEFISLSE